MEVEMETIALSDISVQEISKNSNSVNFEIAKMPSSEI